MLAVSADPIDDPTTVLYQRLTAILSDLVLLAGVCRYYCPPPPGAAEPSCHDGAANVQCRIIDGGGGGVVVHTCWGA